jgi:transposase
VPAYDDNGAPVDRRKREVCIIGLRIRALNYSSFQTSADPYLASERGHISCVRRFEGRRRDVVPDTRYAVVDIELVVGLSVCNGVARNRERFGQSVLSGEESAVAYLSWHKQLPHRYL